MFFKAIGHSHSSVVKVFIMRKELVWAAAVVEIGAATTHLLHAWLVVRGPAAAKT